MKFYFNLSAEAHLLKPGGGSKIGQILILEAKVFDKLDAQAVKAVLAAREEARRSGHEFLDTEQLLLGLMSADQGAVSEILEALGLNKQSLRKELNEILGSGSEFVGVETPFTERMKSLLVAAWQAAQDQGKEKIGSVDLLQGFAVVLDGVSEKVLLEQKINREKLLAEIKNYQSA